MKAIAFMIGILLALPLVAWSITWWLEAVMGWLDDKLHDWQNRPR